MTSSVDIAGNVGKSNYNKTTGYNSPLLHYCFQYINMFIIVCIVVIGISLTTSSTVINNAALNTQLAEFGDLLYNNDVNRVTVAYELQGKLPKNSTGDMAPDRLFQRAPPEISTIASYVTLQAVQDNYIRNTKINEPAETSDNPEINSFLDAVFNTSVLQEAHKFLVNTGNFSGSYADFKSHVHRIWFTTYKRQGATSSSGFEHVFVGEMQRGNKPSGLHNWVRYMNLEKAGDLNYLGWKNRRCIGTKGNKVQCNSSLVQTAFQLEGKAKKGSSTFFVGTSPEFEMALYTVCLMVKPNENCRIKIAGDRFTIRARYFEKYVGTAYPIV